MPGVGSFLERNIRYILILPLVVMLLGLTIFPTLYAYYMSVHKVLLTTYRTPEFNGLANYLVTLRDKDFHGALRFSTVYAVVVTVAEVVLGLSLALLFSRRTRGRGIAMSLLLLPMMVSPALLGIMFRLMLNEFVGVVAYYLDAAGLPGSRLLSPQWIVYTLMGIDVLQWTPFTFIILFAALQTVPGELYEAALVDGAGRFQIFQHITLPLIMPFLVIATFLRGIDSFKVFDMIQVLTGGGPGTLTTSISIYIYKMAFNTGDFGRANASSILLLFLLSIPLALAMRHILREPA